MNEFVIEATRENLPKVISFVNEHLEAADCNMRTQAQIDVAAEELFINISSYAYNPEIGTAVVQITVIDEPLSVEITFIDNGRQFDPLAQEDPDVTLSAAERPIGGLGIYMVKKSMDDVHYDYSDGKNILTIKKNLS